MTARIHVSRKPGNCEPEQTISIDHKVQTTDELDKESQTDERREEHLNHIKQKKQKENDKKQRLRNKNQGVPKAPENLKVMSRISDNLILEWKTPKEIGGSMVTGYNIYLKSDDSVDWRKIASIKSHVTSYKIIRLKMDTHYEFGVSAENKIGEGEAANVEVFTVLHKKPAIKKCGVSAENTIGTGETSEVEPFDVLQKKKAIKKCGVSAENTIGTGETSEVESFDVLQKKKELNILIVGKLGCGKSATGNTICEKQEFKSQFSSASTTTDCQYVPCLQESVKRYISVVDTPTLFEIQDDEVKLHHKITELFHQAPDKSFHVILLVIAAGRFTNEDNKTVRLFMENFGEVAEMCTIIVFSHEDQIGTSIEEFLQPVPEVLDFYLKRFGRRYIGFNNKSKDPIQVERLFTVIDKMMLLKEYKKYTPEDFKEAQMKINKKPVDKEEVCELDEETKAQLRNEEKMKIEKEILEEKQNNKKLEQKLNSSYRHSKVQSEYARGYQQHGNKTVNITATKEHMYS